jgi:hypothetical protein
MKRKLIELIGEKEKTISLDDSFDEFVSLLHKTKILLSKKQLYAEEPYKFTKTQKSQTNKITDEMSAEVGQQAQKFINRMILLAKTIEKQLKEEYEKQGKKPKFNNIPKIREAAKEILEDCKNLKS